VNLIQFKILIIKQVPFGVLFSALISSACEDDVGLLGTWQRPNYQWHSFTTHKTPMLRYTAAKSSKFSS